MKCSEACLGNTGYLLVLGICQNFIDDPWFCITDRSMTDG